MDEILVSISCTAYNHEKFIRECLEGFVMQKTNFRFEAIVHDDASTDGTAEIIMEYARKYPDIIKPIIETENQYSKKDGSLTRIMRSHMKGKYVAMCEGDDYWTDPYKLQKQIDFLEAHPDYSICGHWVQSYNENTKTFSDFFVDKINSYDLNYYVNGGNWCPTLSVVYRKSAINREEYKKYKIEMDIVFFFHLLKYGKAYCIQEKMAVYRIHGGGVWSGKSVEQRLSLDFSVRIALYEVEKSKEAALFLRKIFLNDFGRKWMLQNLSTMVKVSKIFRKHFGRKYTYRLFFKFFFKRNLHLTI